MMKYIVFLLLIAGISACGEKDNYPLKSQFVLVNAAPNAPGLNIFVDNNPLDIAPLSFPDYKIVDIIAGKRSLKIGTSLTELLFDSTLFLVENRNYSLYFIHKSSKSDTIVSVLRRDTLTIPAINKAKLRFINLSPDISTTVNFSAYGAKDTLEHAKQPYKNFPTFAVVNAGNYKIGYSINSTEDLINLPDSISLETGKIYTIYLHGLSAAPAGSPQSLGLSIIENN